MKFLLGLIIYLSADFVMLTRGITVRNWQWWAIMSLILFKHWLGYWQGLEDHEN